MKSINRETEIFQGNITPLFRDTPTQYTQKPTHAEDV